MKTAILITEGEKQIMFTPENDSEKEALKYISPHDEIHTIIKKGTFSDISTVFGANIYKCRGDYYRAEENEESIMFVLTPKETTK